VDCPLDGLDIFRRRRSRLAVVDRERAEDPAAGRDDRGRPGSAKVKSPRALRTGVKGISLLVNCLQ